MKLTNLIPIKAGKTLSRLCIIGALSLGSSFVFAQNQQVVFLVSFPFNQFYIAKYKGIKDSMQPK